VHVCACPGPRSALVGSSRIRGSLVNGPRTTGKHVRR
jgi:hypothetical protein